MLFISIAQSFRKITPKLCTKEAGSFFTVAVAIEPSFAVELSIAVSIVVAVEHSIAAAVAVNPFHTIDFFAVPVAVEPSIAVS